MTGHTRPRRSTQPWALLAALALTFTGCPDDPPADDDDVTVPDDDDDATGDDDDATGDDDDDATGDDDDATGDDDDATGDDDDSTALPRSSHYGVTGGGGSIASPNYRARIVVGAPQPAGAASDANRTVRLGLDPSR